jgi:hypothetical protein
MSASTKRADRPRIHFQDGSFSIRRMMHFREGSIVEQRSANATSSKMRAGTTELDVTYYVALPFVNADDGVATLIPGALC